MKSTRIRGAAWVVIAAWIGAGGARGARADDVAVRARVEPATVEVGGQAVLTVEVEGKFRRSTAPELPPLEDFDVFEAGTSQNFSFVNGQARSSVTFSYVLSPRKEGTFRIEPIRVALGDKQYTANPVVVAVVAGGAAIPAPGEPPASGGSPETDLPAQDQSIFVAAAVDRDTVYVNEQVTWTLGYYADGRVELLRAPNYSPPSAEGFWVEDLPPQNKYYATIHNRRFLVSEIKRAYFPTAPGVYTIGEARVDVVLDDARGRFDDFFNRGFRGGFGEQRSLTTQAKRIVVLPLPGAGKPSDFGGAVASNLTVSLVADKQVTQVGEPINVSIEVNGVGNMRTLSPPKLAGLEGFKVYESGNATDSFKKDYLVSGRRKFDFVMIPQAEGKFTLPGARIAYYDPRLRRYQVAQADAIPIEVKPGTNEDGRKVIYAGGDDFEVLNRDIRYIHPLPAVLAGAPAPFYTRPLFLILQALPALGVVASLAVERRRRRLREDVGFARATRAGREAQRRLGGAEKAFRSGSVEAGYGAIHAALFGYFADRMNAPVAGLTSDAVETFLRARQVGDAPVAAIRSVIGACDAARFAAGRADAEAGVTLARTARDAIGEVERALK